MMYFLSRHLSIFSAASETPWSWLFPELLVSYTNCHFHTNLLNSTDENCGSSSPIKVASVCCGDRICYSDLRQLFRKLGQEGIPFRRNDCDYQLLPNHSLKATITCLILVSSGTSAATSENTC